MKKTARQVVRKQGRIPATGNSGQTVHATGNGKRLAARTRSLTESGRSLPDFAAEARALGFGRAVGNRLLKRLLADEAVS